MANFTLFPFLPPELRHLTWTISLPGPRRIALFATYSTRTKDLTKRNTHHKANPTALFINRESRSVALKHYKAWHYAASLGWQYIDFSIDSIHFNVTAFPIAVKAIPRPSLHLTPAGLCTPPAVSPYAALLRLSKADLRRITTLELEFRILDRLGEKIVKWMERWIGGLLSAVEKLNCLIVLGSLGRDAFRDGDTRMMSKLNKAREICDRGLEGMKERKKNEGVRWVPPVLRIEIFDDAWDKRFKTICESNSRMM